MSIRWWPQQAESPSSKMAGQGHYLWTHLTCGWCSLGRGALDELSAAVTGTLPLGGMSLFQEIYIDFLQNSKTQVQSIHTYMISTHSQSRHPKMKLIGAVAFNYLLSQINKTPTTLLNKWIYWNIILVRSMIQYFTFISIHCHLQWAVTYFIPFLARDMAFF